MEWTFDIGSFLAGLIGGGVGASFLTYKFSKSTSVKGSGRAVDQSHARAGGDVVGGDKSERK